MCTPVLPEVLFAVGINLDTRQWMTKYREDGMYAQLSIVQ